MPISENIKALRDKYGITQKELAEIAGVSDKAVSTWELGTYEPRMGAIQKIADHFGIQKSNLIEDGGMQLIPSKKEAPSLDLSKEASARLEYLLTMVDSLNDEEWQKVKDYLDLLKAAQQGRKDD